MTRAFTKDDVAEAHQKGLTEGRRATLRLVGDALAADFGKTHTLTDADVVGRLKGALTAAQVAGAATEAERIVGLLQVAGLEPGQDLAAALASPTATSGDLAAVLLVKRRDRDIKTRGLWLDALKGDEAAVGPLAPAPDAGGADAGGTEPDPRHIAAAAQQLMRQHAEQGLTITVAEAVAAVRRQRHLPQNTQPIGAFPYE